LLYLSRIIKLFDSAIDVEFQKQKRPYITGVKVRRVNADNLSKILIPVPQPEEQARIVAILDKFDTLTSSISEGLPREIASFSLVVAMMRSPCLALRHFLENSSETNVFVLSADVP
jgi:hypothetical protein